jgi:hypothetical protein
MNQTIEALLRDHSDLADTGKPQPSYVIAEAERALAVDFPTSFKEYLAKWGWISFGPNQYMGLGTKIQSVVETTRYVRQALGLPVHFLVVCDHEGDEYVCLDTQAMKDGECRVVIWDSPTRQVSRPRSENFYEFLISDMRAFIE